MSSSDPRVLALEAAARQCLALCEGEIGYLSTLQLRIKRMVLDHYFAIDDARQWIISEAIADALGIRADLWNVVNEANGIPHGFWSSGRVLPTSN